MKLTLFKNEVIPVYVTLLGNKVVKATELYAFLKVKEKYSAWIKRKLEDHKLIDNKDFCIYSEKSEKISRGRPTVEYILRLHSGKKIALGTNNAKGDQVKDYFIQCEETFKQTVLDIKEYANKPIQKGLVKQVAGVLYNNGDTADIIEHHQRNYKIHFGVNPSEFKNKMIKSGHKVKSMSGREIARRYKPESACSMAYHDEMVSNGHSLEKLQSMELRQKLEPAFKAMMDLGFIPVQLLQEKNLKINNSKLLT